MEAATVPPAAAVGWWASNAQTLKTLFRMVFGLIWLIDGSLKFAPGFVGAFAGSISGSGQPAWLQGWFSFWATQVNGDPAFWVYLVGSLELLLGLALIFGFVRKVAYAGGAILSLFIWAVPEGFGGPYGPGSTDIGTGAMYALLFLALILLNATYGPSRWSLDAWIERRVGWWARLAELRPPPAPAR
jgi:thiosulfate dehydrogenase (quinone) large subunit